MGIGAPSAVDWLRDEDGVAIDWGRITQDFRAPVEAIIELHHAVWNDNDPVLLELCRLRMATLLNFRQGLGLRSPQARAAGLTEDKIHQLNLWPTSTLFTHRERACLSLAEQVLMDAAGTTDDLVQDALEHLSPAECYRLVQGISAMESLQRLVLVLGLPHSPEEQWLDAVEPTQLVGGPS